MNDTNDQAPHRDGRKRRGGLFVCDTEICERWNIPEREGLRLIRKLDEKKDSGFPPKIEAFGDRRYWPAVLAWSDLAYGTPQQAQRQPWVRPDQRRSA
jgi:hypothetical protein